MSYFGDADFISSKIRSFAHTEFDTPEVGGCYSSCIFHRTLWEGAKVHQWTTPVPALLTIHVKLGEACEMHGLCRAV
jgi:hypothetical protein